MKKNITLAALGAFALVAVGLATVGVFGILTPIQPASALKHTTHDSVLVPVDIPEVVVPDVVISEDAMFCTFRIDGVIRMEWLPSCDMVVVK